MELLLVQHGQAASKAEDPSRPLTPLGAEEVEATAVFAARSGVQVDEIRHSGKQRARETAEILAETLNPTRGVHAASGLNPDDEVEALAATVGTEEGSLMLVAHLPLLGRLAGLLVAGDPETEVVRFTNAGIVCLVRDGDAWLVGWAITPRLVGPGHLPERP